MKTLIETLAITVTLGCIGLTVRAGEPLALENPGFENQLDSWTAHADGGKSKVIAEAAHSGKLGLRVTDESETDGCMIQSSKFACVAGKTYEAKFWSRFIAGEGAAVYLKFFDDSNKQLATNSLTPVPADTSAWKEFSVKAVAPETASKVMIWIHTINAAKATVDFDDFSLTMTD